MNRIEQAVVDALDDELRQELVDMTCDMVNIPSPTGAEAAMAQYVGERFRGLGLKTEFQEVEPERNNVVARWRGTGSGSSFLFNGHFDTGLSGTEETQRFGLLPKARIVDGEWIYGLGVSNMKVAFACYYGAIKMLQKAGVEPAGDLVVAGVVGETEKAPTDQYAGPAFRAGGLGTLYAAHHGALGHASVIGEPTGLLVQTGNTSYMYARVQTTGVSQHTWSKEVGVDAIGKAVRVLDALREWEAEFEGSYPHPRMGSRIGFGAIQGGRPFQPCVVPAECSLYVDFRFPPTYPLMQVERDVRDFLARLREREPDLDTDMALYLARPGYEIEDDEPVVKAVEEAHRQVFGKDPGRPTRYRYAVSADTSILHGFGVPSLTYGPGGIRRDGGYSVYDEHGELVGVHNLVMCAKVYALTALRLCGTSKSGPPAEPRR